jgi:Flp pilus assembly pilin Flp
MPSIHDHLRATSTELVRNEDGQTTTEYALVIAAVVLLTIGALIGALSPVLDAFFGGITF